MRRFAIVATDLLVCGPAIAGPTCTTEPKAKWLTESAMKAKIANAGYTYRVFKVTTGNCYEIYGRDKAGKRVEVYFHPITGQAVEQH
jgi:hypothetical protein